jgi:tRNA G37 N-methylase Trm5
MFAIIAGMVVFALFIGIMGFAFIMKKNIKRKVTCNGGCSVCKH